MGPRKSTSESTYELGYPGVLQKFCKEEDVLIIPQFVPLLGGRQLGKVSPKKSKDSKLGDRFGSTSVHTNDSKGDDLYTCGCIQPPQMWIVYENPDDKDTPVTVICKGIYIEFALINAIGKSLEMYPTISCLKIENCCISKEIVETLASILAEDRGKWVTELSLDGNENLGEVLPLLVKLPTAVRYLSLQRCSLNDEDVRRFAEELAFSDAHEHKLQILNLSMNKIGNLGLCHLAEALRTNRSLMSLSLAGNQIEDEGAVRLAAVLQKFQLTFEEVVLKRKRIFEMIYKKKSAVERYLEEWRTKGDTKGETEGSRTSIRSVERIGRRIRGPDGKIRCLSSRDRRTRPSTTKVNSGEKFRGKPRTGTLEGPGGLEPTPSEILALVQQVESEIIPDKHPFVNEVVFKDGSVCCKGCWTLANINLSFNYLTSKSLEKFTETVYSQGEMLGPKSGLLRLVVLPGNSFEETSVEFQKLQSAFTYRSSRKETTESNLDLGSSISIHTARKHSSSGKWNKNR